MKKEDVIIRCKKLINKFLLRGTRFVDYACFQYGACQSMISGEISQAYIDDFQYFVFVKSTKSLYSIRRLLAGGMVEDVLILLRTMFEGYLASRYIAEQDDKKLLNDFIFVPQQITRRKIIFQEGVAKKKGTDEVVEFTQWNPSQLKLGKDKGYFVDFYAFLCNYAHCNFSILPCYVNEHNLFSLTERKDEVLAHVLVLFVYAKVFESVVTVEGEDFPSTREEKECYSLVRECVMFLEEQLGYLSSQNYSKGNDALNKHMKDMFKNMKKSLREELGSVKKDFLSLK